MSNQTKTPAENSLTLQQLQHMIQEMFGHKDQQRGIDGTFMWFMEEVGELAGALRSRNLTTAENQENLQGEFADVLAWLVTLANLSGIDLAQAVQTKYMTGCPRCGEDVCQCRLSKKP